jgi:hypothetical protein
MRNRSLDCEALNSPAFYQVRRTLERYEPLARENPTLNRYMCGTVTLALVWDETGTAGTDDAPFY